MLLPRIVTGALPLCLLLSAAPAAEPRVAMPRPASAGLLDAVAPAYRDAVGQVVRQPTLSAKAADDEFTAHVKVYDWLLEHPDRASLAWRRMKVPCVEITDLGNGQFHWSDPNGSELTWRTVGRRSPGLWSPGALPLGWVGLVIPGDQGTREIRTRVCRLCADYGTTCCAMPPSTR